MRSLNKNSTFKDFQNLLVNEDDMLKRQILYLNSDEFEKTETDLGYLQRNFHFFMAIVLQGVSANKDKKQNINFLHILYPDINKTTYENDSTWRRNAGNFIDNEGNIKKNINDALKNISPQTPMSSFMDGTWYDLQDQNANPIFHPNNVSIFSDGNNLSGEERAKEKMKQIAEFLINGKQITSSGGFTIMTDPVQLLKSNMQLIMNGAPGTGKTYSARNDIAENLLGSTCNKKVQMDMVQFHPSYDYTDFIEGIRPVMATKTSATTPTAGTNSQNNSASNPTTGIGYTLKNGAFKRFCRRAGVIERLWAAKDEVTETNVERILNGEDDEVKTFWKKWIGKEEHKDIIRKLNDEIKKRKDGNESDDKTQNDSLQINIELPPFLFIIDEINRAEISKVLGETMYCLDADYRGPKGMIATQYSSMATDESFYVSKDNDKFFIPSNVYIIGTMNDIDRSVEVFDFALRRRFAWFEVKAEDVMETVLDAMGIKTSLGLDYDDYKTRIEKLNKAIEEDMKLNRHYHLGPSYFAKIKLYLSSGYADARREVWNNHLSQILYEYVKGKRTEDKIEEIGKDFCD